MKVCERERKLGGGGGGKKGQKQGGRMRKRENECTFL